MSRSQPGAEGLPVERCLEAWKLAGAAVALGAARADCRKVEGMKRGLGGRF